MAQFLYAVTLSNINRFLKIFTVRIGIKFAKILSLKIPLQLKYAATLPCEMSMIGQTVAALYSSRSVMNIMMVSGVAGFNASSSSKADT